MCSFKAASVIIIFQIFTLFSSKHTRIFTHTQLEKFTLYLITEYTNVRIWDDKLCSAI